MAAIQKPPDLRRSTVNSLIAQKDSLELEEYPRTFKYGESVPELYGQSWVSRGPNGPQRKTQKYRFKCGQDVYYVYRDNFPRFLAKVEKCRMSECETYCLYTITFHVSPPPKHSRTMDVPYGSGQRNPLVLDDYKGPVTLAVGEGA